MLDRAGVALVAAVIGCVIWGFGGASVIAQDRKKAVILSINDVYRIGGINSGRQGGMARVRALRAELEKSAPDLLFLHAGDFLSPSFLGRSYRGAQMIDLMNVMDGSAKQGSQDERMFVAFGNHEFDDSHCGKAGPLPDLVARSEFTWLASNLDFSKCKRLSPLAGNEQIASSRIVESGGMKIGLYGLTLPRSKYKDIVADPLKVSCQMVAEFRAQGVDAVVALTHLAFTDDLRLMGLAPGGKPLGSGEQTCADQPDIVVGGHDHLSMALPTKDPRLFKADADAVTAWVIELSTDGKGGVSVNARLEALNEDAVEDPLSQRISESWILRHDERFCATDCVAKPKDKVRKCLKQVQAGACLTQPIAKAASLIETEEIANRSLETGFGNWVADTVRAAGKADIAFINAGAIRLNYNIDKGTTVTRRHLEEMFPFKNKLVVRDVPGRVVWAALERAFKARGEGAWAHFSGLALKRPGRDGKAFAKVLIRRESGEVVEIGPASEEPVKIASLSFVLANGDRHGFKVCPGTDDVWACKGELEKAPNWPAPDKGDDLAEFVRIALQNADKGSGVAFQTDGRICEAKRSDCLVDRWTGK
ncbi:MAG: bifunctional metallophosphatase/5'-nucleotidase [Alphaproteobacteria bacterium]|nr:bifunctional metallophosphatase/5'-nucleotidase [Alphaproteobacteria bacterium]